MSGSPGRAASWASSAPGLDPTTPERSSDADEHRQRDGERGRVEHRRERDPDAAEQQRLERRRGGARARRVERGDEQERADDRGPRG